MTIMPHRLGEVKKIRMCQKLRSRVLNEEFCKMHFRHSKICFEAGLPDFYRSKNTKTIPNENRKILQMVILYTNIFHSKTLQNLPKLEFLV
jgi:hypothetical protein